MRGSVWVYILCYLTTRQGRVFAKQKVYGYSEVREINSLAQQKVQYYKAINKALAVYRTQQNLDSDTEVGYTHLNDGITYEGKVKGVKRIKRKKTKLSGADKREQRRAVLQNQKATTDKTISSDDIKRMYDKKVTLKEYNKLNRKQPKKKRVQMKKKKVVNKRTISEKEYKEFLKWKKLKK